MCNIRILITLCAVLATSAQAQIDKGSPARGVSVWGSDQSDTLFQQALSTVPNVPGQDPLPYYGDFNESVEGFGLSGSNVLAAFADQRSFMAESLDELGTTPILLQGSASLVASINEPGELRGTAGSAIEWDFSLETHTTIQFTWALAATSSGPEVSSRGFSGAWFSLSNAPGPDGVFFNQTAELNQLTEGGEFLTLGPGSYSMALSARLNFVADSSGFDIPTQVNHTAAYTVTMAVVPTPAIILPFSLGVWATAPRRRRKIVT